MPQRARQTPAFLPLSHIIAEGGGPCELARKLKITSSAIAQWDGMVPPHRALDVAFHTNIPADRIRPDYWGAEALQRGHVTTKSDP